MTKKQMTEYGYKLRAMRLVAGLTQREVGIACGYTSARTVQYWECGQRLPGVEKLRPLATVLKVPVNQVVP